MNIIKSFIPRKILREKIFRNFFELIKIILRSLLLACTRIKGINCRLIVGKSNKIKTSGKIFRGLHMYGTICYGIWPATSIIPGLQLFPMGDRQIDELITYLLSYFATSYFSKAVARIYLPLSEKNHLLRLKRAIA